MFPYIYGKLRVYLWIKFQKHLNYRKKIAIIG